MQPQALFTLFLFFSPRTCASTTAHRLAFVRPSTAVPRRRPTSPSVLAARYGPPTDPDASFFGEGRQEAWEAQDAAQSQLRAESFTDLLNGVLGLLDAGTEEEVAAIPALVGQHVDVVLGMRGYEGVDMFDAVVENVRVREGDTAAATVEGAIGLIVDFAEEFTRQAKEMEETNRAVLGRIMRAMGAKEEGGKSRGSGGKDGPRPEDMLDEAIAYEKENFTPGFLRHLNGQIERINAASSITQEGIRMVETLGMILIRVVEEMGKNLGEGGIVLGQLVGYEKDEERMSVLRSGLQVRGISFAQELRTLTEEALDGFSAGDEKGMDAVDPVLVERVRSIDRELESFIKGEGIGNSAF
eukprot:CAMPEP_0194282518 /NCGR_PEP_ID=MMETSP0169-20130528/23299_1 /TAXON_ID=218684 /ORGANISM="Corethron pennatum, Strain L29A3" /LENGTH=355 /DNA_ID=CAMNT_0039027869 /DNA_START=76 /DNA_END=1143 /DNA_ORIENTATION=-